MGAGKPGAVKSLAIGAVSLAVAWEAYSFALVPNLRRSAPEVVLNRNPSDAVALSKSVSNRVKESGEYVASPRDRDAARQSLADAPLSRSSLRILGFDYVRQGDKAQASKLMAMSDRVSRRDTWAQIWLLEEAARAENFDGILTHYHAALSVKPELAQALNPVLVSVTRFPEVRVALRPYLRANASWTSGFLSGAASQAPISDIFDMVLPVAHHLSGDSYVPAVSQITYRLAADGRTQEAMTFAQTAWRDFGPQAFAAFAPDAINSDPRLGKLSWTFGNEGGISSQLQGEGAFEASLGSLSRGIVASRTIPLRGAGNYSFTQRVEILGSTPPSQLNWQAECVGAAALEPQIIWRQSVPLDRDNATYQSSISVPDGCNLLTLSLLGNGPEGQATALVLFDDLQLKQGN